LVVLLGLSFQGVNFREGVGKRVGAGSKMKISAFLSEKDILISRHFQRICSSCCDLDPSASCLLPGLPPASCLLPVYEDAK